MYCLQCGHKLPDEARFCGACGAPVTSKSVVVNQTVSANEAAASPEGTRVTFAAAMDSAKKRSRRHIPVPILVVLVTLLMSSVAFASYWVYTNVIAPPEEQEQAVDDSVVDPIAQAEENYAPLLDEFRDIQEKYMGREQEGIIPSSVWSEGLEDETENYPILENSETIGISGYSGIFRFMDELYTTATFQYAFIDLNGDGSMELLVSDDGAFGTPRALFTYSDNQPKVLATYMYRNDFGITSDNYIGVGSSSAFDIWSGMVYQWDGGETLVLKEQLSYEYVNDGDRGEDDSQYSVSIIKDGVETNGVMTYKEVGELVDDYSARYSEKTDFEWREL